VPVVSSVLSSFEGRSVLGLVASSMVVRMGTSAVLYWRFERSYTAFFAAKLIQVANVHQNKSTSVIVLIPMQRYTTLVFLLGYNFDSI
jgi:hypothetical protein